MQPASEKTKEKLLTDTETLLMIEYLGSMCRLCHSINKYAKANSKYLKDYKKINNIPILNIRMKTIYVVGQCNEKNV